MVTPVCNVYGVAARRLVGQQAEGTDHRHKKCGDGAEVVIGEVGEGAAEGVARRRRKRKSHPAQGIDRARSPRQSRQRYEADRPRWLQRGKARQRRAPKRSRWRILG